jgi:DNA ligase-associated metallophosphoesterase
VRESGVKAHRSPLARRTPSPLVGEGWGRGSGGDAQASTHAHDLPTPTPIPSPQGGGEPRAGCSEINVAGATLVADCAGALYWPDESLLVIADLHLEKGSAFAARGVLLPPYDTAATLARLATLIERYAPRLVIALGDSFHDGGGPARMSDISRAGLKALQRGRDWLWIAGNHDPDPADNIGGRFAEILALGPLTFRHEPSPHPCAGEIAGHLHPQARIARRGRAVSRRCFASDGKRLVMPAFGAYAGGLNVRDRAIVALFGALSFTAHMLSERRIYAVAAARCLAD